VTVEPFLRVVKIVEDAFGSFLTLRTLAVTTFLIEIEEDVFVSVFTLVILVTF
jgi:hypothetical protein